MSDINIIIEKCIEEMWNTYNKDNSGHLDKTDTKSFVKNTLTELVSDEFSETDFNTFF